MREGVRRARELERTSALLPDDAPLEYTGTEPSTVPDEPDYDLVVKLWEKACAQVPVGQIEAGFNVDTFRVRHALAHWLEEEALRLKLPEAAAPAEETPAPESPGPGSSDPGT